MKYTSSKDFAIEMDQKDPLKHYRDQFYLPKKEDGNPFLYFCGNSLGLQPKTTKEFVNQELTDWANLGVEGHFHAKKPWMPYHEFLSETMSAIVGAQPHEVVVMNSLTVNLHLMMISFYRPTDKRHKILIEGDAFPSDKYAVASQLNYHGYNTNDAMISLRPKSGEQNLTTKDILLTIEQHGDEIALVMMGGVNYYTGQKYDMKAITKAAHLKGCKVGFDLAHAVGNVNLELHDWDVDFAVWCTYKYLNGGPGSVGGCFVHDKYKDNYKPRLAGWWGHEKDTRFKMPDQFIPITGAEGWQMSNAPILSMAALRASLEIYKEVGMEALRTKAELLTGYLEFLLLELPSDKIKIFTTSNAEERGCQISLNVINDGKNVFDNITKAGVIADWREPDVIRLAPVPLYNSYMDVYQFIEILKKEI